jgi:hypothetical protein
MSMRGLRRHLIVIALALLAQQGAGVAAVAALECCRTTVSSSAKASEGRPSSARASEGKRATASMSCCKKAGSAHICPLGKPRSTNAARCRLTGGCNNTDERGLGAALFLLSSPAATLVTIVAPQAIVVLRETSDALPLDQTLSPPTHPPKF